MSAAGISGSTLSGTRIGDSRLGESVRGGLEALGNMELEISIGNRPTWARVEQDFYVASRHGEFVGYIDRARNGSYVAFDGLSSPVGRYDDLRAAKRAVESVRSPQELRRRRRTTRVLQRTAAAAGMVAGGVALTAGALAPFL